MIAAMSRALVNRLLRWRALDREMDAEFRLHLDLRAADIERDGVPHDEAVRRARLEFGNVTAAKETARATWGWGWLEQIPQDVRYALRGFRRTPTFTLTVVLTIAIGAGLSTSAFTLFNAYVLRPLDVRDPHSLYDLGWLDREGRGRDFSRRDYDALARGRAGFSEFAAYRFVGARLAGQPATGNLVSGDFFRMMGVGAAIGRTLGAEDVQQPGASPVIVLSHNAWQRRFGGDSGVIGRRVLLHGRSFAVVGVARAGFEGLTKRPLDFWAPVTMLGVFEESPALIADDQAEVLSIVGRLDQGASAAGAYIELTAQLKSMTATRPDSARVARLFMRSRASAIPLSVSAILTFTPLALVFGLVLVIACANVANMMLARSVARQREIGIRLSIGAERGRIIRQLLTESALLAVPAAIGAFVFSWFIVGTVTRLILATIPADLAPYLHIVSLQTDLRVLTYSLAVAVIAAVAAGVAPAMQSTRLNLVQAARGTFDVTRRPSWIRNALVVGQVTVSVLFLVCAVILVRGVVRLQHIDSGLRTRDVVSIEMRPDARAAVLALLKVHRMVDTVASATALPLDQRLPEAAASADGGHSSVTVGYNIVSAGYFDVLRIAMVRGRSFAASDERSAAAVVIVTAKAAHQLWPDQDPLGHTLRFGLEHTPAGQERLVPYQGAVVIGVARDVLADPTDKVARPVIYLPGGSTAPACCFLARVRGDPDIAKRTLDADLERELPGTVGRIDRLETFVAGSVYPFKVAFWVALVLGGLALLLTATGIYGVVGYGVTQRTREIGVRLALGATPRDAVSLVLRQSVRHAVTGIAIGALLALGVARFLASNVQAMEAFDIVAFGGATIFAFAACLGAAYVPARRVAQIDPVMTLRED